jgi:hypothetical protein
LAVTVIVRIKAVATVLTIGRKIIIPVRRLTAKQARDAHLRRSVGIAVARVGGTVTGLGRVRTIGP